MTVHSFSLSHPLSTLGQTDGAKNATLIYMLSSFVGRYFLSTEDAGGTAGPRKRLVEQNFWLGFHHRQLRSICRTWFALFYLQIFGTLNEHAMMGFRFFVWVFQYHALCTNVVSESTLQNESDGTI
mmetsp:Transcript_2560/g.4506  ORF Transcript_2560/g.4506 Transcript_2560/m.4506 type:complete len:126 (+) Transcript_2560:2348-2725(+)